MPQTVVVHSVSRNKAMWMSHCRAVGFGKARNSALMLVKVSVDSLINRVAPARHVYSRCATSKTQAARLKSAFLVVVQFSSPVQKHARSKCVFRPYFVWASANGTTTAFLSRGEI